MKEAFDMVQFLIQLPGPFGLIACWVIVFVGLSALKISRSIIRLSTGVISWIRRNAIQFKPVNMIAVLLIALPMWALSDYISDAIQYVEQRYISPAYQISDTTARALAIYEAELSRQVDPYELEVIKRRTRQMAQRHNTTPLAIYEVAYSECGLNPFCIRKDGIAAGWIQFTTAGLQNLTIDGQRATLEKVKQLCLSRDIEKIMDLTDQYFQTRASGKSMPRACDVYTCVFAPGYLGCDDNTSLYSGRNNPSYYLNAGLDGYYVAENGQIIRSRGAMDGRITITDMRLALEAKKSRLIQSYQ